MTSSRTGCISSMNCYRLRVSRNYVGGSGLRIDQKASAPRARKKRSSAHSCGAALLGITTFTKTLAVDLAIIVPVAVVAGLVTKESVDRYRAGGSYSLLPVEIPDRATIGVTPESLQSDLLGAIRIVMSEAVGRSSATAVAEATFGSVDPAPFTRRIRALDPGATSVDLTIPNVNLSLRFVGSLLDQLFGVGETQIAARLVCLEDGCSGDRFKLVVTIGGTHSVSVDFWPSSARVSLKAAAIEIIRVIDPYVIAARQYLRNDVDAELNAWIAYRYFPSRKAHSLALLGAIRYERGETEVGLEYIKNALKMDKADSVALAALARIYRKMSNEYKNIHKCIELERYAIKSIIDGKKSSMGIDASFGPYKSFNDIDNIVLYTDIDMNMEVSSNRYLQASMDYWDASISYYRILVSKYPTNPVIRYNYANALDDGWRYKNSVDQYNIAVEIDPFYVQAHLNLAEVQMRHGELKKSAESLRLATMSIQNPDAFENERHDLERAASGAPILPEAASDVTAMHGKWSDACPALFSNSYPGLR